MIRPNKNRYRALLEKIEENIKRVQKQLTDLRKHDILTGVANLAFIREKLSKMMRVCDKSKSLLGVLIVGIDNFTTVNVRLGSAAGDQLLQEVTARMIQCDLFEKTLARKGGDEFIVLLNKTNSPGEIAEFSQELLSLLSHKFYISDQEIYITVSIGISLYPQDGNNVEDLLAYADIALRYAKRHGKNNYQFFTQIMGNKTRRIQQIQEHLPNALERQEFFLCYQPQVSADGVPVCFEALLRWNHPTLGLLMPHDFILIAEEEDYMVAIGNWVLHQSCSQVRQWHDMGFLVRVAVNVSARQFYSIHMKVGDYLIDNVRLALQESALEPKFLELELSERMMVKNPVLLVNTIKKLKQIGVRIVCDDFGVGYSSFSRLKSLSLDTIKIDQSLVQDLPKNKVDEAIVKGIIDISKQLNANILAEGVERRDQYQVLVAMGCDLFQGFYTGKPMLPEEVVSFLRKT